MFIQKPKFEIDVGQIGNASTGDILYDGGEKINENMTAIYNSFGDQRFYDAGTQTANQVIHATGYFQKVAQRDLRTPLAMGTQWDVDTSAGAANPILAAGKPGEQVRFVNTNGSIDVSKSLVITPSGGSFVGIQGPLKITQPFSKVTCWCISSTSGVAVWDYSVESIFGSKEVPIERTESIPTSGKTIKLVHSSEYSTVKLLITAMTADGTKMRSSETNLLIDTRLKNVLTTEYAVLRVGHTNEDDEIVDIKYEISIDGNVNMVVATTVPSMRMSIKSIATQRVGSA